MAKLKWEEMADKLERIAVPGGWLVKTYDWIGLKSISVSICFYPDPQHLWESNG